MSEQQLVDILREASDIKKERSRLKEEMSRLKKQEDELLRSAREIIDQTGLESVKFLSEDGSSMIAYRTTTIRASIGDEEQFRMWCQSEDGLDTDMFRIFSPQKLTSLVRERTEDESPIPEGVRINEFDEVRIRRG